jgi:hypothetical protein
LLLSVYYVLVYHHCCVLPLPPPSLTPQVVSLLGPVAGRLPDGSFGYIDGMTAERVEQKGEGLEGMCSCKSRGCFNHFSTGAYWGHTTGGRFVWEHLSWCWRQQLEHQWLPQALQCQAVTADRFPCIPLWPQDSCCSTLLPCKLALSVADCVPGVRAYC